MRTTISIRVNDTFLKADSKRLQDSLTINFRRQQPLTTTTAKIIIFFVDFVDALFQLTLTNFVHIKEIFKVGIFGDTKASYLVYGSITSDVSFEVVLRSVYSLLKIVAFLKKFFSCCYSCY